MASDPPKVIQCGRSRCCDNNNSTPRKIQKDLDAVGAPSPIQVEGVMEDLTAQARRRVLLAATLQSHDEWTTIVRRFYRVLFMRHPRFAAAFDETPLEFQVQKLIVLLNTLARDPTDRSALDLALRKMGATHASRGITRTDFSEFVAILAEVLADAVADIHHGEVRQVWLRELAAVTDAMLLAAPAGHRSDPTA
jgi:hemoglobin-like flavoprotein